MSIHVQSLKDLEALLASEPRVVLLDFYANFCGPCKAIAPFFEKMAASDIRQHICFVKVDCEAASEIAEHYGVTARPTFMAIKANTIIAQMTGASKDKLAAMVVDITKP
jgi:thioredoxin